MQGYEEDAIESDEKTAKIDELEEQLASKEAKLEL